MATSTHSNTWLASCNNGVPSSHFRCSLAAFHYHPQTHQPKWKSHCLLPLRGFLQLSRSLSTHLTSPMEENWQPCGKRARATPNAEMVKLEEGEVMQGEGQGGAAAEGDMPEPQQIDVMMDMALLHCQACLLPLKPPIFKCDAAGHILCCYCHVSHGEVCSRAGTHCGELDAFVGAARVPCAHREFGCADYVAYHDAADHHRACRCAPCSCPEPGCVFLGSRDMLLDHFASDHSRPLTTVRYGRSWNLSLSPSNRWHVLVGEEDRSLFIVFLSALGAATAVSLVCVRAEDGATAAPRFLCKLSVEPPGEHKHKWVQMGTTVASSALSSGAPATGQGMFLVVPQELLSGSGAVLELNIRIDQLRTPASAKSTTPQARTPRRMH